MQIIVSLLAFAAVFLLVMGVSALVRPRVAGRRLARLGATSSEAAERESLLVAGEESTVLRAIGKIGQRSADSGEAGPLRQRLSHAGSRGEAAPAIFYGLRIVLALALPSLLVSLPIAWQLPHLHLVLVLCLAAGVGFVAPSIWLDTRRSRRQNEMRRILPDALDLMVVCVEAGYAINASLARVAREVHRTSPVVSTEFELVTLEIRAGKSGTDALRALSERTGVSEVASLVAMLVQTERFGTSVADTLRVHADSLRVQRLLRAEEQAGKAPLKMMFPTLIIFIATLVVTIGPGLIKMFGFFKERT